jgi:hypothetical protein
MKFPKYTHAFIDHDGTPRFYLRVPGRKRFPLPGLPWSPEFMEAREVALRGDWEAAVRCQPNEGRHSQRCDHRLLPINRVQRGLSRRHQEVPPRDPRTFSGAVATFNRKMLGERMPSPDATRRRSAKPDRAIAAERWSRRARKRSPRNAAVPLAQI